MRRAAAAILCAASLAAAEDSPPAPRQPVILSCVIEQSISPARIMSDFVVKFFDPGGPAWASQFGPVAWSTIEAESVTYQQPGTSLTTVISRMSGHFTMTSFNGVIYASGTCRPAGAPKF